VTLGDTIAKQKTALSVADVAGVLQTTSRQVRKMIVAGELPSIKIGNAVRFDPQVFSDWLGKRATTPKFQSLAERKLKPAKRRNG